MSTKISDIRVFCTAPEGINLLVVKVITNQPGLYGLGCGTFAYRHLAVKLVIEEYLKPLLIGKSVEDIDELWQLMHQNAYWRNGPIENNAISGIDIALWDIKGKMAGMPLYKLFGGKCRSGVHIYRHANGNTFEELCENIDEYIEDGVKTVRCQVGGYGGGEYGTAPLTAPENSREGVYLNSKEYISNTIRTFEKLRDKYGDKVGLVHDVHERLNPSDSIRFAKEMEKFNLTFLEDSLPLEQLEWFKELRRKTSIPLAEGELFTNPFEWKQLISERLIDFLRVHITFLGGITPSRKLIIFAEQYGVRTAFHGPGDMSPLAHAANIHLDLSAKNFGIQEWSGTRPPNFIIQKLREQDSALTDVFIGMPEYKDGYVYPNDKHGLGIEFNELEAKKYPCESSVVKWTQTRSYDGTLQLP